MTQRIPLTRGQFALVDDADYRLVARHKWHVTRGGYAARTFLVNGKRRYVYMHRLIARAGTRDIVDHRDGDPLNNTRSNLRLVTGHQNAWNCRERANETGYRGVSFNRRKGKYYARIQVHGRRRFLGYYDTPEAAAEAYDAAARTLFGDYSYHHRAEADVAG